MYASVGMSAYLHLLLGHTDNTTNSTYRVAEISNYLRTVVYTDIEDTFLVNKINKAYSHKS
jgi:hypothetical protein